MAELDGICHEEHEPINIDSVTGDRLRAFLQYKAPPGMGCTAFIEWALAEAEYALTECNDEGDLWCMTHQASYVQGSEVDGELTYCEVRENINASMGTALHVHNLTRT